MPRWLTLAVPAAACLASAPACAHAQDWAFTLTPYLWAQSLEATAAPLPALPPARVDLSFSDLVDELQFAFTAAFEARRGKWGVLADISFADLGSSQSFTLRDERFIALGLANETLVGTAVVMRRVHERPGAAVDLFAGARVSHQAYDLRLSRLNGAAVEATRRETWIDPVVGARADFTLSPRWSATAYGDIGGFGAASDLTYQFYGALNFRLSERYVLSGGYRYYADDFERDGFVSDVVQQGPIVAVQIRF